MKWPNKRRRLGYLLAFGNISLLTEILVGQLLDAYFSHSGVPFFYGGSPTGYCLLLLPYLAVSTGCLLLAYYYATKKDNPAIRTGVVTILAILYLCIVWLTMHDFSIIFG